MNSNGKPFASQAAEAERKRAAAKKLIQQYYFQLTEGCGDSNCDNIHCASNPYNHKCEPNEAAALAIRLLKSKPPLCVNRKSPDLLDSSPTCIRSISSSLPEAMKDLGSDTATEDTCMDVSAHCSNFSHQSLVTPASESIVDSSLNGSREHSNSEPCQTANVYTVQEPDRVTSLTESFMDTSGNESCPVNEQREGHPTIARVMSLNNSKNVQSLRNDGEEIGMEVGACSSDAAHKSSSAVSLSGSTENSQVNLGGSTSMSKLSPAKVMPDSSSGRLVNMPISEETNCMEVSIDEANNAKNILHTSDSVPCNNAENASSEFSSLSEDPSTSDLQGSSEHLKGTLYLNEERLLSIIEDCKKEEVYSLLIRTLGQVFSSENSLQRSFEKEISIQDLCKEDIRAMEIDEDKDHDSKELGESSNGDDQVRNYEVTVDIESLRRSFKALFSIPGHPFQGALINALIILSENVEFDLKYKIKNLTRNFLNIFVIVMEIPMLECSEYMESAFPAFCKTASLLPVPAQAKLASVWSTYSPTRLKEMVDTIHQFITLKVITGQFTRDFCINDDEAIVAATKLMKILYYANMLGGTMEAETQVAEEAEQSEEPEGNFQDFIANEAKEPKEVKEDALVQELGLKPIDCRSPVLNFEEFYNEPLSDQIEMDRDFACYKTEGGKFSFMNYAFILTPAVKALGLYYDNRIRMYSERRISVLHSLVHGAPPNPYLKLRVRRDHLIDDALVGLEMVAMENPNNLKKQLVVEFEGEQGIDEGGVSKEFFQLVVEEVFNPDFAMFTLNSETQTYWFNPTSFESDGQFILIGIILGLAIYNNIILDVHFPMVLYRKLMGKKGTFYDLQDWNPNLSKGLQDLLEYKGDDIETVFLQTFRITYQDVFGSVLSHDLKENGDNILVNQENKQEFVELYASFLLNKSVAKQFRAFRRGFQMVTDDSPLKLLFRPEEIELLVCGSRNFDFNALEEATDYDGGYSTDTPIIKWFWELVHDFSLDQKRKLLQFATGSDRVPVGGLSKLKLVITRHGHDTDRLPTAHTCFNVLLLPEYASKEKLEERLLKAINYSKGFGML